MVFTLERMQISNFKGIRELAIDFAADVTRIQGMNGTGKTSIADAFSWCIWNKDSHGNAPGSDNFHEKPLDADGHEIHNIDTTVELFCTLDGLRFDLKRTQRENWVKKRGSVEQVFQGNSSTYWINGVEVKQQEYRQRVATIGSEDVFRLIGSLSAFNALDWKKRREQLLALAGTDVDGELLQRQEYRQIADELAQRNIGVDDLRKVLADQRKRCNDELKMLPVRIDEAKAALPNISDMEYQAAKRTMDAAGEEMAEVDADIATLTSGGDAGAARAQTIAMESELISLKRRVLDEHASGKRTLQSEADMRSEEFRRISGMLAESKRKVDWIEDELASETARTNDLRAKFLAVKAEPVNAGDGICPTCGQHLPEGMIEAARAKALDQKRERLEQIKAQGTESAQIARKLDAELEAAKAEADELSERAANAQKDRDEAFALVKEYPADVDFSVEPRIAWLEAQLETMKADKAASPDGKLDALKARKRELADTVDRAGTIIAQKKAAEDTERRIQQHEARQKEVGAQLTETEVLIGTLEKFVQDRCGALEASINAKFPTVRWKLFDIQINGGIADTCVAMLDCGGAYVPYESANTAARINADIEIVNVLSKAYDVSMPLFVDNAERVNRLANTDMQLITMAVSTDSELKIK